MYENDNFLIDKKAGNTDMQRKFLFSKPVVLHKMKLDEILGDETIAIKIEFLGIDRSTKISIQDPFNGGYIFKRKYSSYLVPLFIFSTLGMAWQEPSLTDFSNEVFTDSLGKPKNWLTFCLSSNFR